MFCPQCSQHQISEEMRFCSRCGFPLEVVSQLVANDGVLIGTSKGDKSELSPRQRGIRKAALFLILSAVLTPIVGSMTALDDDFVALFIPVFLVFVYGLARLLYALLLESTRPKTGNLLTAAAAKAQQLNAAARARLSAGESVPISNAANWRQPLNTSEMAQPHSVTDNTTRLLKDEAPEK